MMDTLMLALGYIGVIMYCVEQHIERQRMETEIDKMCHSVIQVALGKATIRLNGTTITFISTKE